MNKILKFASYFLLVLISIIILILVILITSIHPNDFKPLITNKIRSYTHQNVTIDGDLTWTFFPNLGLKVGHMSLSTLSPGPQKLFVEVANTIVEVKLLPLLHRKFEMLGLNITGAHLIWTDTQTSTYYEARNVQYHAKNIALSEFFPASISFDFQPSQSSNFIHFDLTSRMKIDTDKQTLDCENIQGNIANAKIVGTLITSHLFDKPSTEGKFSLKSFSLIPFLKKAGYSVASIQSATNTRGDFTILIDSTHTQLQGNWAIDELVMEGLHLTNLTLASHLIGKTLDLNPIVAHLYGGSLQSQIKIDFNSLQPLIFIKTKLDNIHTDSLLHDLITKDHKISLSGLANIDIDVTTSGIDGKSLVSNLNGASKLDVSQGALTGIDLNSLINNAFVLLKKKTNLIKDTGNTHFDRLTGSAIIHNGIILSEDLLIESPIFMTKGRGKIDLPSHWVNYLLYITIKKDSQTINNNDLLNVYSLIIPVAIRGALSDPNISLDAGELLKEITLKQIDINNAGKESTKEQVKQQIKEQIKQNIPGPAGDLLQHLLK